MDEEEELHQHSSKDAARQNVPAPDFEHLRRLKEAVNEKMRERVMMGIAPGRSMSAAASRRFSPIKEEESSPTASISPSLEAAFASPVTSGAQTASTESTESARTIRGSVPPTPGNPPLRTPSYPFPYVPGTPRVWNPSFHNPFTTLSPTVSSANVHDHTPGDRSLSEVSTPAANAFNFLPPGMSPLHNSSDEDYPSPNLYNTTLELNLEPGMHAWWSSVVRISARDYHAFRASLAVPADAGDLENVPWCQVATYNEDGVPTMNPDFSTTESEEQPRDNSPMPSTPGAQRRRTGVDSESGVPRSSPLATARPMLSSRHSYAGFANPRGELPTPAPPATLTRPAESTTPTPTAEPPARPAGPARAMSAMPRSTAQQSDAPVTRPTFTLSSHGTPGHSSTFSELEFSSVDTEARGGPYSLVLPTLRSLEYEDHALIDSKTVNRVIDSGRVCALTRHYSAEEVPATPNVIAPSSTPGHTPGQAGATPLGMRVTTPAGFGRGNMRLPPDYFSKDNARLTYEEFEQFPSSPWAQSPAPSPAIQANPEEDPFFSQANIDESSFDPRDSETPDYTKSSKLKAIGVDCASTVIHIPLIHPTLSQILPASKKKGKGKDGSMGEVEEEKPRLKKAPIAILSLLTHATPYPENLIRSLRLLAPHLATSLGMAQQYSDAQRQASALMNRRLTSHRVGFAPFAADREGLENLIDADIEQPAHSVTGSVTSPSDYSGRSRASPGGSLVGTPGWEMSSNIMGRLSAANTPGLGHEMAEGYFDMRSNRSPVPKNSSSGNLKDMTGDDQRPPSRKSSGHEDRATRKSGESRRRTLSQDDKSSKAAPSRSGQSMNRGSSGRGSGTQHMPTPVPAPAPASKASKGHSKQHSYLHSYGADFASSFNMPPTASTPGTHAPNAPPGMDDADEEMLPPSERLLRTIIDSLPVQLFTASPTDGKLTWVNSKFIAYRGKRPSAILRDPWAAIHPQDRDQFLESWQQSLSTGQQFSNKVRLQRFDKEYRYFFIRATPLKDKRQNIVHWIGTFIDVHEQHLAEQNAAKQAETAASEKRYRALANSSPQIVFEIHRRIGVTFCNSQWLIYSGQTEEEAKALGFLELVHPKDVDKCKLPIFNPDGSVSEIPMTTMPTEVQRSDTGLSSSEDSFTSDARTVTSPSSTPTSQLPQTKLAELATAGIVKVSYDADGRPSYSTEVRLRRRDGEFRWHLVRILQAETGILNEKGDLDEIWYGTCTDINDHKLLEKTLKDTMEAKSRFLSNMSHEIRTPLNGIMGMVNFLLDTNLTVEQLEHVHIIRNSTEGLRDLINDILDLSKVEAGMITLSYEWFHLRSLIEEVNDLTNSMAGTKGLELNYLIEEGLPSSVKGDRFRIRQVLLNVVGNAIKFTQTGEVFVKVEPYIDEHNEISHDDVNIRFSVIDTGAGFTQEESEFLFKRFSQIDSSSTKQHGGTGLGLAISKQLVQLHGGDMDASSVPGKGASFFFHAKFTGPSDEDQPPTAIGTPGPASVVNTPGVLPPRRPSALPTHFSPKLPRTDSDSSAMSAQSPLRHESTTSSASSEPSVMTNRTTSVDSHRSSISSLASAKSPPMILELPTRAGKSEHGTQADSTGTPSSSGSTSTAVPARPRTSSMTLSPGQKVPVPPTMLSILIISPLTYSRQAIARHIETTIPQHSPHHITVPETLEECGKLLGLGAGNEPVNFTHVVLISHDVSEFAKFAGQVLKSPHYSKTVLVGVSDVTPRKEIEAKVGGVSFDKLLVEGKLHWITKPVKPAKLAVIFDPRKLRELSQDRSQDSAQAVVLSQKQIFEEMKVRLGNRGMRVLLVEDNKTNQMV